MSVIAELKAASAAAREAEMQSEIRREATRLIRERRAQRCQPVVFTQGDLAAESRRNAAREENRRRALARAGMPSDALALGATGVAGSWADDAPALDPDALVELYREEDVMVSREELVAHRETLGWLRRDEIAAWLEQRRRTEGDQARVDGDYWGAGPAAEKAWLDARIAQLRIEYRELLVDASRKGVRPELAKQSPQLRAVARHAESLRHRHNFKRYVEALGCDPECAPEERKSEFDALLEKAETWRKETGLTYAKATERLATVHRARWIRGERWTGVEGLIAV